MRALRLEGLEAPNSNPLLEPLIGNSTYIGTLFTNSLSLIGDVVVDATRARAGDKLDSVVCIIDGVLLIDGTGLGRLIRFRGTFVDLRGAVTCCRFTTGGFSGKLIGFGIDLVFIKGPSPVMVG